jgi:hypothetical protein
MTRDGWSIAVKSGAKADSIANCTNRTNRLSTTEKFVKVEIDVPDYSPQSGLRMEWDLGCVISATTQLSDGVLIEANRAGLISLARLLLTLADDNVSSGSHWHLDDLNALEEGSIELVIEKK